MPTPVREESLADGQLTTTNTTLISGADVPTAALTVIFVNASLVDVEITVTFKRAGGTARRLGNLTLEPNEEFRLVNLPIQPDDSLLAVAGLSGKVDYLILGSRSGSFHKMAFNADGALKQETSGSLAVAGSLTTLDQLALDELSQHSALLRRILVGIETIAGGDIGDPETPAV